MLMFAKTSLQIFIYDVIDVLRFPTNQVKVIYQHKRIINYFIYLILTDTGSCSLQFFLFAFPELL